MIKQIRKPKTFRMTPESIQMIQFIQKDKALPTETAALLFLISDYYKVKYLKEDSDRAPGRGRPKKEDPLNRLSTAPTIDDILSFEQKCEKLGGKIDKETKQCKVPFDPNATPPKNLSPARLKEWSPSTIGIPEGKILDKHIEKFNENPAEYRVTKYSGVW